MLKEPFPLLCNRIAPGGWPYSRTNKGVNAASSRIAPPGNWRHFDLSRCLGATEVPQVGGMIGAIWFVSSALRERTFSIIQFFETPFVLNALDHPVALLARVVHCFFGGTSRKRQARKFLSDSCESSRLERPGAVAGREVPS